MNPNATFLKYFRLEDTEQILFALRIADFQSMVFS